jgi:hypothetical protein
VADASAACTTVTVDGDYTLKASFLSWLETIYVDDDAWDDPGPGDGTVSDVAEDGTWAHPFDRIQEGIDVAVDGATVVVREGVYEESVVFCGRAVTVSGFDPNAPSVPRPYPVIDANDGGPAVCFAQGEDLNCVLTGFAIIGGGDDGVRCEGSSPTVSHCLVVGNRGAGFACIDSNAVLVNCTIADNAGGLSLVGSDVVLANSIVWGNGADEIMVHETSEPFIAYSDVAGGWPGAGNIELDPSFAQPGWWVDPNDPTVAVESGVDGAKWIDGDYHLRSQAGRWDPVTRGWVLDEASSLCIDAGDPSDPAGDEPLPNGGIVNLGAYGGTTQAGKSPQRGGPKDS